MAKRKSPRRGLSKKKPAAALEMTRVKLLYGLSGIFTLAVAGLLLARPAPLSRDAASAALAARAEDPLEAALQPARGMDPSAWKRIVIERAESLGSASFHFAILPQNAGDQIAISSEWSRQVAFNDRPGELRVVLISPDAAASPQQEKSILHLVERLSDQLKMAPERIEWR